VVQSPFRGHVSCGGGARGWNTDYCNVCWLFRRSVLLVACGGGGGTGRGGWWVLWVRCWVLRERAGPPCVLGVGLLVVSLGRLGSYRHTVGCGGWAGGAGCGFVV
jgi:hypothetical protein